MLVIHSLLDILNNSWKFQLNFETGCNISEFGGYYDYLPNKNGSVSVRSLTEYWLYCFTCKQEPEWWLSGQIQWSKEQLLSVVTDQVPARRDSNKSLCV